MKKILLLAAMAAVSASAFAGVDAAVYEPVDGFTLSNLWIKSQFDDKAGWDALPIAGPNFARTAALLGDKLYIAQSKALDAEGALADEGSLIELDFFTGEYLRTIELTVGEDKLTGLLCANQVAVDDYDNLWIAGYVATTFDLENNKAKPIRPYVVDLATGACTAVGDLELPAEESEATGRLDYYHCVGDITGEKNRCVFMTAVSGGADLYVYGWQREQRGDWTPFMNGGEYVSGIMTESYPADQTTWGTAPSVTIIRDDEFSGEMFYVDGFTTCPTLYNSEGSMVESFEAAPDYAPALGCNGVGEFSIGGADFIAYVKAQYDGENTCQVNICKLGEGQTFEGMELCYTLPAGGLGQVSDGGNRIHCIPTKVVKDSAGKQAAYFATYKCANGVGVYCMAENGFNRQEFENGDGVAAVVVDNNAPAVYYNIQGMRVGAENLTPGLYIVRQGNAAKKVIIK